ncbi:unnamed protein product, partial [Urochloa humidicola]
YPSVSPFSLSPPLPALSHRRCPTCSRGIQIRHDDGTTHASGASARSPAWPASPHGGMRPCGLVGPRRAREGCLSTAAAVRDLELWVHRVLIDGFVWLLEALPPGEVTGKMQNGEEDKEVTAYILSPRGPRSSLK